MVYSLVGTLLVIYGIIVYYALPYAIIHVDLTLLLTVFFGILTTTLVGLTMLA